MKGCLRAFQPVMNARILIIRSRTEGKDPRWMTWRSMMPNQISTNGRVRLWNPGRPGVPVGLGGHDNAVAAVAVLPDGQIVSGGRDGRVRLWNPTRPGTPVELGTHNGWVQAVAVLPDGRVVSGSSDGRVRLWNPVQPGVPADLGAHNSGVTAVAVLPDGRVISADDNGLVVWGVLKGSEQEVSCPVAATAASSGTDNSTVLVVAHRGGGISGWSCT